MGDLVTVLSDQHSAWKSLCTPRHFFSAFLLTHFKGVTDVLIDVEFKSGFKCVFENRKRYWNKKCIRMATLVGQIGDVNLSCEISL